MRDPACNRDPMKGRPVEGFGLKHYLQLDGTGLFKREKYKEKVPPGCREDFIFSAFKKEKLFLLRSFLSALFLRSSFLSFFSGFFLSCHDFLNLIG